MSESSSALFELLIQLSDSISESLSKAPYTPPDDGGVSSKALLVSLLPHKQPPRNPNVDGAQLHTSIRDFALARAVLSSPESSAHDLLSWIPKDLAAAADLAFRKLWEVYSEAYSEKTSKKIAEVGLNCGSLPEDKRFMIALLPEALPLLKRMTKERSIDKSEVCDEVLAASARVPVGFAIVAAYQFRWFVTQGQGMNSFIHIAKNENAAELGWYQDVFLDACCQNIASSDEIWELVVEMSVLIVTCTQQSNPRSSWHIFPLFFKWMHADDDETVLLVLKQIETIIKLTWVRNTQYVERCKGVQFKAAWGKHRDDPNLATIGPSLGEQKTTVN